MGGKLLPPASILQPLRNLFLPLADNVTSFFPCLPSPTHTHTYKPTQQLHPYSNLAHKGGAPGDACDSLKKSLLKVFAAPGLRDWKQAFTSIFGMPTGIMSVIWVCKFPRTREPGKEFSKRSGAHSSGEPKPTIRYYLVELDNKLGLGEEEGSDNYDTKKVGSLSEVTQPYINFSFPTQV